MPVQRSIPYNAPVTVSDTATVDLTLTGQALSAALVETYVKANVMTTRGDLITQSLGGVPARLGVGLANQVLKTDSSGLFLQWGNPALTVVYNAASSVDPASIAANSTGNVTVTVAGALTTDTAIANPSATLATGLLFLGCRTAAGGVVIYFYNVTASAIDQAAINWNVMVLR